MKQITSLQHPLVKRMAKLVKDKAFRYQERVVVVEGIKQIEEMRPLLKKVLASDAALIPSGVDGDLVTPEIIEKISGSKQPEGIIAEIEMPTFGLPKTCSYILGLDGVADPGNLGTLIRTALALGWEGVFLIGRCCDPFNDKAMRAAKGATFRIPLEVGTTADFFDFVKKTGLTPVVATLDGEDLNAFEAKKKIALILGSESHGPSDAVLKGAVKLTIPIVSSMESLNVASAGAILMYKLRKNLPLSH